MTSVVERLKACESDPMWADHSEISKRTLREVIALLYEKDAEIARLKKDNSNLIAFAARQEDDHLIASQAKRLALELECLLNDTQDMAKVSKWWDSAMEALQLYRDACSVAYSGEQK